MRTTLTLTVPQDIAEFVTNQQGLVDPSALMNKLIHEDMERKDVRLDPEIKASIQQDELIQALELFLDENTHSAE